MFNDHSIGQSLLISACERILKIGQYLAKLWARVVSCFFTHVVVTFLSN